MLDKAQCIFCYVVKSLGLGQLDLHLATLLVFLDPKARVPDFVYVAWDPAHDEVMQVIVQRDAPFLDAWVGGRLYLVPVTARKWNNEVSEAHVLDEFVRRLAQT